MVVKEIIVEKEKIVFRRRNLKIKEVIKLTESIITSGNKITLNGINDKGMHVSRDIKKNTLKRDDYDNIRFILKGTR